MAINIVKNTTEEKNFKFLTNQSSILLTDDTNTVTVNGVNVIVDKPKKGDIMCVNNGEVIWIDGLSINPKWLSQDIEPVGICVAINGNKAMVRYRKEERKSWAAACRWELQTSRALINGTAKRTQIVVNGKTVSAIFTFSGTTYNSFVTQLNDWFKQYAPQFSAELVKVDTDLPFTGIANDISIRSCRVIINCPIISNADGYNTIMFQSMLFKLNFSTARVDSYNNYYKNNGFTSQYFGGCCRAKFYQYYSKNGNAPTSEMTSINNIPDNNDDYPVALTYFEDTDNSYCQILRDNFSSYDEYIDSMMINYPCGKDGNIINLPSGKENTYKLANCTFVSDVATGKKMPLYAAANYAASINVNAPGLEAGNWWLPSPAEMVQMMRDVTYGTDSWNTNPDIVNTVLDKMFKFDKTNWSMLSPSDVRWTSSKFNNTNPFAHVYSGSGAISNSQMYYLNFASPITIYEF